MECHELIFSNLINIQRIFPRIRNIISKFPSGGPVETHFLVREGTFSRFNPSVCPVRSTEKGME